MSQEPSKDDTIDISQDGGVLKKILKHGTGDDQPKEDATVVGKLM
jgi:hypothetical protein